MNQPRPIADRFWPKVQKTVGCWEWIGGRFPSGYGSIYNHAIGRSDYAHRVSWILAHGPIPPGGHVLHTCDNPPCVRPDHLFLGDPAINAADRMDKGRGRSGISRTRGAERYNAKLTDEDITAIRADPRMFSEIADAYGVSVSAIKGIRQLRTWRHVPVPEGYVRRERGRPRVRPTR